MKTQILEKLIDIFENKTDKIKDYKFKKGEVRPNNGHGMYYYWLCYKKLRITIIISEKSGFYQIVVDGYVIWDNFYAPTFFEFKKKRIYNNLRRLAIEFIEYRNEKINNEITEKILNGINKNENN